MVIKNKPSKGREWVSTAQNLIARQSIGRHFWQEINCSKFECSTINWSTLLAGNQLLDTKFINCLNPVNPGSTGFEQLTKKVTIGPHC